MVIDPVEIGTFSNIEQACDQIDRFISKTKQSKISDQLIDRLLRLKTDLPEHQDLWIHTNLYTTFNPDTFIQTARNSFRKQTLFWVLDGLDITRNIFILFPVLLTWLGLSQATTAYARAIAADPQLNYVPFLALWERGFNGELKPFLGILDLHFSAIAWLDAVLLAGIIVLSIAVHILRDHLMERHEKKVMELAEDLHALLWNLDNIFITYRQHRYENTEQRAMALMVNIDHYVRQIRQQVVEVIKNLSEEEKNLMERAQENQEHFRQKQNSFLEMFNGQHQVLVKETNDQISNLIQQQQVAFSNWSEQQQVQLGQLVSNLAEQQNKLITAAETHLGRISQQQNTLITSAEAHFNQIDQQQRTVIETLAQSQQSLLNHSEQIQQVVAEMRQTSSIFRQSVDDMGRFIPSLNQTIHSFGQSLTVLAEETGEIRIAQNRMIDALQSLEGMIAVFEKISGRLVVDMRTSADHLIAVSTQSLSGLSSLTTFYERVDETGRAMTQAASAMAQNNSDRLSELNHGLQELSSSLAEITNTAQTLTPILEPMHELLSGLKQSLSQQMITQHEQLQELRETRSERERTAILVNRLIENVSSVVKDLDQIAPLLHQVEAISNRLCKTGDQVAERLKSQDSFHARFDQLEGLFKQVPPANGDGNNTSPIPEN